MQVIQHALEDALDKQLDPERLVVGECWNPRACVGVDNVSMCLSWAWLCGCVIAVNI